MRGIEILSLVSGVYFLYKSYNLFKDSSEDVLNLLIWPLVGLALVSYAVFPGVVTWVSNLLGMEIRAFTIFSVSILVLFLLVFHLLSIIRRLDEDISKLNEELSVREAMNQDD